MNKFNGRKLRYIREQRGVSQLELSKACEVPQSLLSKYERGEVKSPPASAVQAFADYFNVAYGYFFGDVNSISLELSYPERGEKMVDWKKALSMRAVNAICNEFEVGGVNSLCHWRDCVEEFDFNIRDHRNLYVDHPTWMIINFGIKSQKEVDSFLVAHWPETNVRFHPNEKNMDRRDGYLREQTRVLHPAEKLIKQIDLFSEAVNADWFSHNHIYAFAYICKLQPIPLRDLQQRMGVEKSLLNRLVHSLGDNPRGKFKGANLVTVRVMPHDRRQREVRLTYKGEALMDIMFPEEGKK